MSKLLKHVALSSLFLVLVLFSVYFVLASHGATISAPSNLAYINDTYNFTGNVTFGALNFSFYYINGTSGEVLICTDTNDTALQTFFSCTADTTGIRDGNYTIYATSTNATGTEKENSTQIIVRVANTAPSITINQPADNIYKSGATQNVTFNFSVTSSQGDLYSSCNVTVQGSVVNGNPIEVINGSTGQITANLSEAANSWTITCYTNSSKSTTTTARTYYVDNTPPSSATITVPSSDTEFGTNVEIKCENADATAGVNDTVITITRPRGNTVVKRDWNSTTSVTLTLGSGSEKDLDELGTYKVDCTVKDKAGNSKTASQKTFVISAATSGGGGTGAGGIITHSLGVLTAEGKTQLIRQNDKATFTIAGTLHTATVTNVGTDSATITIESEPITLTIKKGETKKIDFEKDNVYDLAIRLVSIIGTRAQLEFKAISESYAGEAVPYEGAEEEAPEEVPEEVPEEKAPTKTTAIWLSLIHI